MKKNPNILDKVLPTRDLMAWIVCLSAGLFFFYEFFQLNLFDVINQSLRKAYHIDASQLSWMSSSYLWANILFLLPAGIILDRYSVRWVILSAMSICVVGTVGFGLSYSFFWASIFHSMAGIGNAFCFLSCIVLVSRWFPPRRQALVVGCIVTMAFLGGMMAHTPLIYLNEHFGWRNSLLIDGGVGGLLLIWLALIIKDRPGVVDKTESIREPLGDLFLQVLRNKQNWLCGMYTSCMNLTIMVLGALWGASYLMTSHHLSAISASNTISCLFIGSMLGCPFFGWFSDLSGRRKLPMVTGAVLTLGALSPLFLFDALSEVSLGIIFFSIGFFTSAQVVGYPCVAESNSEKNTGSATGIASVIVMGGAGVGQVIFAQLLQHHAGLSNLTYQSSDYQFALRLFPMAIIVALLSLFLMRETHCSRIHT